MDAEDKKLFKLKDYVIITEDNFLVCFKTRKKFTLNQSAVECVRMLDGSTSVRKIAKSLSDQYNIPYEVALQDTENLIKKLLEEELIEAVK